VENNRNSLCVVLAGYKDAMMHLMAADPGLVRLTLSLTLTPNP